MQTDYLEEDDLSWMQETSALMTPDRSDILRREVTGRDSRQRETESYPVRQSNVPCSFNGKGGREVQVSTTETVLTDGSVRYPYGTIVHPTDKIVITHQYRKALDTPLVFRVVGIDERPTALVVQLSKVGS